MDTNIENKLRSAINNVNTFYNTQYNLSNELKPYAATIVTMNELKNAIEQCILVLDGIKTVISDKEYRTLILPGLMEQQIAATVNILNTLKSLPDNEYLCEIIKISKKLTKQERKIFYCFYIKNMDFSEAENEIGIKEKTIKSHLYRMNLKFGITSSSKEALTNQLTTKPIDISDDIIKLLMQI